MQPFLTHGRRPWQIKATTAALLAFYIWTRYFISEEPKEIETLPIQAVVVSDADAGQAQRQPSTFKVVNVRLPDGTHAYVTARLEIPQTGATVDVLVKILGDGTRRVSLRKF